MKEQIKGVLASPVYLLSVPVIEEVLDNNSWLCSPEIIQRHEGILRVASMFRLPHCLLRGSSILEQVCMPTLGSDSN